MVVANSTAWRIRLVFGGAGAGCLFRADAGEICVDAGRWKVGPEVGAGCVWVGEDCWGELVSYLVGWCRVQTGWAGGFVGF